MTPEMSIEFLRMLVTTSLLITAPVLLAAILVGVVVSLLQAITSIQEPTLSFAPKLLAVGVVLVLGAPWMILQLMEFTVYFLSRIAEMTG
jgi:flagellar biosynthesis protein FliQ